MIQKAMEESRKQQEYVLREYHCRISGQAPPAVYRTEYCKDEYCPAGRERQRKSAAAMSRSTEIKELRSNARCWKSVRIMSRIAQGAGELQTG